MFSSVLVLPLSPSSFAIFFFQAEDGIRDGHVTGVQTCALPILGHHSAPDHDVEAAARLTLPEQHRTARESATHGPAGHRSQGLQTQTLEEWLAREKFDDVH